MRRSWPSAALLALVLAGCGSGGDPPAADRRDPAATPVARTPAARPPSDPEQLDRLLERRSAALRRGDAGAYAATATGAQRARDRRAARRAREAGLSSAALSVETFDLDGRRATMRVRSTYSVRGIAGRFGGKRRLVAVKTARGWRVASERSRRERHPWELGRLVRRRSEHFVVLAPARLDLQDLTGTLERGYDAMGDVLSAGRLRRRYLVVVAGSASGARQLTSGIRGVGQLAAITDSRVREEGPARRAAEVVSQRLLVVWPVFSGLDPASRSRIVTHEMTHAALAGVTSGRTPAWLVEGVALYVSGDRRVRDAAGALDRPGLAKPSLSRLAAPDRIARLSGTRQGDAYALASAAAFYLAERFGERAALDLYEAFNDPSVRGRAGQARTTDRALRATLGISLETLERDLRRWIRASAGS